MGSSAFRPQCSWVLIATADRRSLGGGGQAEDHFFTYFFSDFEPTSAP
jgi:hypothetical protein